MKSRILYIFFCISLVVNLLLCVCVIKQKIDCESNHPNGIDKTRSMIPDEETAERIAKVFLDTIEGDWGWEEGVEYEVYVSFDADKYEWVVHYSPKAPEGYMTIDGAKIVGVRKDNGMLTFYAWK